MRSFYFFLVSLTLFAFSSISTFETSARKAEPVLVSPHIVISQFQTGGDGAATFNDEFVELHNIGNAPVELNGYRLVYRSATGSNDRSFVSWSSSTIVQPGGYYLIASTGYNGSVAPNITYNPTDCMCSMGAAGGGLAIRNGSPDAGVIIDSVGWGTATNIFVETAVTAAPAVNNSQSRVSGGCQDTDNNSADFAATVPSAPRNASAAPNVCGGGGTTLFAGISASPNTISPGGNSLLTVTVIPATTPPSTNFTVVGNLSQIGGSSNQAFFDDGTNGDATPNDNVFSYLATVPVGMSGGNRLVVVVAADAQGRSVVMQQTITVNAPLPNEDPLIFGNPSNATPDIANENNYLMHKPQYSLSYNRGKATANWVAWRLDSSWIGSPPVMRQDDFRPDTTLPAGWYQVLDTDYSGSGYDRGHMVPSGDRTNSIPNNSSTFLMTNIIPQLGANNQGAWEEFESYCRTLAGQGNEIYIMSGPTGNIGTIARGKIVVPAITWKVILVIPNGSNDLQRVNKSTRVLGIIVPNQPPLDMNAPWRNFRVTVDAVEYLTGYDFFTNIPKITQELIEKRRDLQ